MGTNGNGNTWANGMTGAGMATMMGGTGIGFGTTAMGIGRDPKARARSRDYLKQFVVIPNISFPNFCHDLLTHLFVLARTSLTGVCRRSTISPPIPSSIHFPNNLH
jgi:hypothetical protein